MANPIVSRTELAIGGEAMTIKGVVTKTSFLLALNALVALGFFAAILFGGISGTVVKFVTWGSMFAAVGVGLFLAAKPQMAKTLAVPYACLEGLFLGGVSLFFARVDPTIPVNALAATFVTAAVMLGLYRSGVIKVTAKFRSFILSAVGAIAILYLVQWVFIAFGSSLPFLFNGGLMSIGFSFFVVGIASFSLLIDFDNIERGAKAGVSEDFEWIYAIGVLATLVWMYFEIMRLLSYFQD